jgi:hypothetical protein
MPAGQVDSKKIDAAMGAHWWNVPRRLFVRVGSGRVREQTGRSFEGSRSAFSPRKKPRAEKDPPGNFSQRGRQTSVSVGTMKLDANLKM